MFEPGGWEDFRLTDADLEWIGGLAPIRLGFIIESLQYTEEEYAAAPFFTMPEMFSGGPIRCLPT
jgi:hypothetical protein